MRAEFEAFIVQEWQRGSIWQIILRPLSWLFAAITATRRFLFRIGISKISNVSVPVIIVGNISAGGTGKTPLVIAIAELLEKSNKHPGVITRGYVQSRMQPRTLAPPIVSQQGTITASDEAMLMSQRLRAPVFANPNRVAAAELLLKRYPNTDVVISDDGLQHYRLGRDIEIAVVDGQRGFGNQQLIPAGPLRESVARLKTVDCIVVNGVAKIGLDLEQYGVPVFRMSLGNEQFFKLSGGDAVSMADFHAIWAMKKIHALAGIGNPQRFFDHLKRLGIICSATHPFSDHHAFARADLNFPDADIILMTEKDAVKCKAFADDRMWAMRVDALLPPEFDAFILERLSSISSAKPD
jgi:tetraacyldisaccharide 4'-kinase